MCSNPAPAAGTVDTGSPRILAEESAVAHLGDAPAAGERLVVTFVAIDTDEARELTAWLPEITPLQLHGADGSLVANIALDRVRVTINPHRDGAVALEAALPDNVRPLRSGI